MEFPEPMRTEAGMALLEGPQARSGGICVIPSCLICEHPGPAASFPDCHSRDPPFPPAVLPRPVSEHSGRPGGQHRISQGLPRPGTKPAWRSPARCFSTALRYGMRSKSCVLLMQGPTSTAGWKGLCHSDSCAPHSENPALSSLFSAPTSPAHSP